MLICGAAMRSYESVGRLNRVVQLQRGWMRAGLGTLAAMVGAGALSWVVGCGSHTSFESITPPTPPPTFQMTGKVTAGSQPVSGAQVELYAAGSSGYGSGASLLLPVVSTDQTGSFTLAGDIPCPSAAAPTYLIASGGTPATGGDNSALKLMAPLGACGSLTSGSTATIDEVTTVASVWALAPFLKAGGVVGTSSGNAQGLTNAFANINNLVTLSTGASPGTSAPANASIPTKKINTLANLLATCANPVGGSGACATLFTAATPAGGTAPGNTLDAALAIAQNPGSNAAGLYAIGASNSSFGPALTAAPADWMLAVNYSVHSGSGQYAQGPIALDGAGNVWVANYFGSVAELSGTGTLVSSNAGFTGGALNESYGLCVNEDGSVWVTDEQTAGSVNSGYGSVTVLNTSGDVTSGANGYFGGGIYFPVAIAADTDGSVWIANYGDSSATRLTLAGTAVSGSTGFGSAQLEGPVAVAIDASHNAWFVNQSSAEGSVTSISQDGSKVNTVVSGGLAPSGVATDAVGMASGSSMGHVWTANYYSNAVSELELGNDGTVTVVSSGYTGGGLKGPNGIAVDGAGNVWVTNFHGASITELQGANGGQPGGAVSPAGGFGQDASLSAPFGVAIDESGNAWVSNQGSNTVTQFLGVAAPVKTPLLGPPQLP